MLNLPRYNKYLSSMEELVNTAEVPIFIGRHNIVKVAVDPRGDPQTTLTML